MWVFLFNDLIQCFQKGKYFVKSLNEKKKIFDLDIFIDFYYGWL